VGLDVRLRLTPASNIPSPAPSGTAGTLAGYWSLNLPEYVVEASFGWAAEPRSGRATYNPNTRRWRLPFAAPSQPLERIRFGLVQNTLRMHLQVQWGADEEVLVSDDQQRLDTVAEDFRPFMHDPVIEVREALRHGLANPRGGVSRISPVQRLEAGVELFAYGRGGLTRLADPWYSDTGQPAQQGSNPLHNRYLVAFRDAPSSAAPSWCTWNDGTSGGSLRKIRDLLSVQIWFVALRGQAMTPLLVASPFTLFAVARFDPPPSGRSIQGPQLRDSYGAGPTGSHPPEAFPDGLVDFERSRLVASPDITVRAPQSGDPSPVLSGTTANEEMRRQFSEHDCAIDWQRRLDEIREMYEAT